MVKLYRRGRVWWVRYRHQGQRIQRSLETTRQRTAERKRRQIEYELETGQLQQATRTPLRPALSAFCQKLMATQTAKAWKNDLSYLRAFFGPACDELRPRDEARWQDPLAGRHVVCPSLEQVTSAMISSFLHDRLVRDRISPKTANNQREVLHRFFAYASREHAYRSPDPRFANPVAGVSRLRVPAPKIRYLTLDQIDEQLDALADDPRLQTLIAVYIFAGLRREEALWLTPQDVDLEARLIQVRAKTIDGRAWQPKTRRNRAVPVSQALLARLIEYTPRAGDPWFFPSPEGCRWDPDNFSAQLRVRNRAAGLPWSCLDYRHTFGTQLAQKGESLYKISELMGNSPDICRRHYAQLMPERMHDVVDFGHHPGGHGLHELRSPQVAETA